MKKNRLTGWRDVFAFTFRQTLKSRAYTGSLIFLVVLALLSMPLLNLLMGNASTTQQNHITKLYVVDEIGLPGLTFSALKDQESYRELVIETVPAGETFDTVASRVNEEEPSAVILRISTVGDAYLLEVYRPENGEVKEGELNEFGQELRACFEQEKLTLSGLSEEQARLASSKTITGTYLSDSAGFEVIEEDTSITMNEYFFIYGVLFVILMVSTISASQVATSIVSDKSSKVVEFLLTSIRPLAIIVGKVLSMLLAVVVQFLVVAVAFFVSGKISGMLFPDAQNPLSGILSQDILANINPWNLLLCLIMASLGLIFYATLAGLTGATVSRIEEVGEGQMLFTITDLIGAYIGIGAAATLMSGGVNNFVIFAFLFPLSSPYILPGAILAGKAGIGLTAGAMVLEIAAVILLFLFVARVYEVLILHNGERIRIKELFRIFKSAKGGKRHE